MSGAAEIVNKYAPPVPKAVREASQRADKIMQDTGAQPAPTTTTVVESAQPPQHQNAPAQPPQPGHAPQPQQHTAGEWEAQYKSLKGKYDAEVPTLRNQVALLNNELSNIRGILANMQSQPPAAAQPAAPAPRPEDTFDTDRQEYGELFDKARKWARAEVAGDIEALQKQIRDLKGETQAQGAATAQQRVHAALDAWQARGNPDWQMQNNDERFIAWLQQVDPFSGQNRGQMLKAAYQAGDANRVVHFFNAYVAEQAALHGQQPNQTQQQPASPPPVSLETLAAPGRGGASAPQGQPQKRIWTSQDVKKLYDDQRRGHFNGRESNFRALEQDLFAAQVEGRYRQ